MPVLPVSAPFWLRFQPNGWSTAVFKTSCTFSGLPFRTDTELNMYAEMFDNIAYGLKYRGISAGLLGKNSKNTYIVILRVKATMLTSDSYFPHLQ